jgi:DNA repair protein SbcC/Rad50
LQSRVKELQQRWSELDKIEGLSAEQAKELGISKRFRALCYQALAPAKGFFEKRQAIRDVKLGALEEDLKAAEAQLEPAPLAIAQLLDTRQKLSAHLRNLDLIDPAARKTLSQRLRDANQRYTQALDAAFAAAEQDKRKLIAKLRRDLIGAKAPAALSAAKAAQLAWKQLPRGKRALDDALWAELNSLITPLFAAQKSQDAQAQAERDARQQARAGLIAEAKALADTALAHGGSEAAVESLEARWKQLSPVEEHAAAEDDRRARGREGRDAGPRFDRDAREAKVLRDPSELPQRRAFESALALVQSNAAARLQQEHDAGLLREQNLSALCIKAEQAWLSGAEFLESWPESAQDKALQQRFERALAAMQSQTAVDVIELATNERSAEQLAMALEYACKQSSPAHLKSERMQYDIQRLNEKHSARSELSAAEEIAALQKQWRALGPLRPEIRAAIQQRMDVALANHSSTSRNN